MPLRPTRIRIVSDASTHVPSMLSVQDLLNSRENLVTLLLKILTNFRVGEVALTANIGKAFLQIEINDHDRDAHTFL